MFTSTLHSSWEEKTVSYKIIQTCCVSSHGYEYVIKVEGRKYKWYLRNVVINSAAMLGSRTVL